MIPQNHNGWYLTNLALWLVAIVFLLSVPAQSDFPLLAIGFPIALISYSYFLWDRPSGNKLKCMIIVGIIARVAAVFFFPNLSDDIYRFIWDGRVAHLGLSPYAYLPTEVTQDLSLLNNGDLLSNMNSPNYYTVYPPVSQLVFYLSSWQGVSVFGSAMIMKTIFLGAELVTLLYSIRLLKLMKMPISLVLIYWLNPLIIIEGIGNLHFEIIMIAFLAIALYHWKQDSLNKAMIFLSLSVGAKLLSLMVLPYIVWRLRWKKGVKALLVFIVSSLIVFTPLWLGLNFEEFLSSIDLYFRKFEFNAGLYYMLRWIGYKLSGYNLIAYIGPVLAATFMMVMYNITIKDKARNIFQYLYVALVLYLLLATTVHPWYLSIPIFCSVFIRSRAAIVWSVLIWLTYINYSYLPYTENLFIVALEYVILAAYIYFEWKQMQIANDEVLRT